MYHISTYDVNAKGSKFEGYWRKRGKQKTKRGTVKLLRKLYSLGYDRDVSIYIERIG